MNKLLAFLCLLLFLSANPLPQDSPRLIVRGDDMGSSHSGNEAILHCSLQGIQTSVEVIVPAPWFPEAARMLNEHPEIDVGVHIALTSEWDNLKWRPLTICPSLTDENGYFLPMSFPNPNYPGKSLKEVDWKLEEMEAEFRAQIEMAQRNIKNLTHISAHMGCSMMSEESRALEKRLAQEYGLDIDLEEHGVEWLPYGGPKGSANEKINSFVTQLRSLKAGKTYIFVEHPGYDNAELRAIHHVGYEKVAEDRQGVTDLFTSAEVKAEIKRLGVELISYADLLK